MDVEPHHQSLALETPNKWQGHWDRTSGPRQDPSHPYPLSGPWQITSHPEAYIACGPFLNPLHFVEVETEAQRSEGICLMSHSKLEVGLELEL